MTDNSKSCKVCTHYGIGQVCYKKTESNIKAGSAKDYRMLICHGNFFIQKKDVPDLTFCYDNLLDR